MKTAILFLTAIALQAQTATVHIDPSFVLKYTADTSSSVAESFGKVKGMQVWTVFIKCYGPCQDLAAEDIYLAAGKVRWRPVKRAMTALQSSYGNKKRNKFIRVATWGAAHLETATTGTAIAMVTKTLSASQQWQTATMLAIPIAHGIAALATLAGQNNPAFNDLLGDLLPGKISLKPGDGATFTMFASTGSPVETIDVKLGPNGTVIP